MRKNKPPRDWARIKTLFVFGLMGLWLVAAAGRLSQLTLFSDTRIDGFSERQGVGKEEIDLPRGMIYDRNFNELAVSADMKSVYLNPRRAGDPGKVARHISLFFEPSNKKARKALAKTLAKRIKRRQKKSFVWIKRKVTPEIYVALKEASIPGVGFVTESKRFYPKRDIGARIIGFCGMDNQGLHGLEYKYEKVIQPVASRFTVLRDALGRPLSMPDAVKIAEEAKPLDLILAIDERIQYVAEKALEKKVKETGAKRGVAIVMDSASGEVLAIGEQPRLNANSFSRYNKKWWRSMALSHVVEPGSTFKLFAVAAALEAGLVTPEELINCENGRYRLAGHTFGEAMSHKFKNLTVSEVIEKSSNIGAIKIAQKLGKENFYQALRNFGFGVKTRADLPGEVSGKLRPVSDWSATSLPSVSFGQEVGVTPIQLVAGVSALANGGLLMRPMVVKAFARDGRIVEKVEPVAIRRTVSVETAKDIAKMMERVVLSGTGQKAAVAGFAVAGKTGTAQKYDPQMRGYSKDKHLSSFVGFFPVEKPRLTILVMIDEPKGVAWGGTVAGPVFSEIASRAARILRIPAEKTEVYEVDWDRVQEKTAA